MVDLCFLRHGHKAIVLAGGSTSLVGDPGGKDKERPMQTVETIAHNVECAKKQLNIIYRNYEYRLVNNIDWTKGIDVLEFLREVGKYFNVGEIVKRDYIAQRIGEGGSGISYTEFSYTLLQGYDYLHLFEKYNCTLQIGGSDQWANCLSGVDLIKKKLGKEVHVMTLPLVINKATGKKFGKSEAGAVWLDPNKTPVFEFYNFWINTDDESCKDYVKIYTEINPDEYEDLVAEAVKDGSKRLVQKYLAYHVTKLVHGENEAEKAKQQAEELFGGSKQNLENLETHKIIGTDFVEFLVSSGILKSKREAREMLESGAIYVDDEKYTNEVAPNMKDRKEFLLRVGKKKYYRIVI
jgi:tyrosyl-tRNA synthetase